MRDNELATEPRPQFAGPLWVCLDGDNSSAGSQQRCGDRAAAGPDIHDDGSAPSVRLAPGQQATGSTFIPAHWQGYEITVYYATSGGTGVTDTSIVLNGYAPGGSLGLSTGYGVPFSVTSGEYELGSKTLKAPAGAIGEFAVVGVNRSSLDTSTGTLNILGIRLTQTPW